MTINWKALDLALTHKNKVTFKQLQNLKGVRQSGPSDNLWIDNALEIDREHATLMLVIQTGISRIHLPLITIKMSTDLTWTAIRNPIVP